MLNFTVESFLPSDQFGVGLKVRWTPPSPLQPPANIQITFGGVRSDYTYGIRQSNDLARVPTTWNQLTAPANSTDVKFVIPFIGGGPLYFFPHLIPPSGGAGVWVRYTNIYTMDPVTAVYAGDPNASITIQIIASGGGGPDGNA